jgi:oligopeptide/dipeptide ABC transporter ATP-binding protein
MSGASGPLLAVSDLAKQFPVRSGIVSSMLRRQMTIRAVDGVSFEIMPEETFGIVGESGSGKSTIARLIARLIAPSDGRVELDGEDWFALSSRELRRRRRNVQMVFQNPFSSLDPRWTVQNIIAEPLLAHRVVPRGQVADRVAELMTAVGLTPGHALRYPHQFSGGQRQRIGLARALALNPRLLIADEPVSALDVSVQAQVLNLMRDVQRRYRLGMLFISHDLSVVNYVCHRVGVLYLGRLVEVADTKDIFRRPLHPYTQALIAAIPEVTARCRQLRPLQGEIPSPIRPPPGCRFHTRCPHAVDRCRREDPVLREIRPGHRVACHLAGLDAGPPSRQIHQ